MKLNLGSGDFPLNDFINIDVYEGKGVDVVCNILKLPYKDNSVEEVYAGHVIEHLTIEEARKGLKEWLRVLKPGCHIGIVVPEKHLTPKHMLNGDKFPDEPYREHHTFWDGRMLKEEAKLAGFKDVETMNINTYPHLVARPHWQVGIIAFKGGNKMKDKKSEEQVIPDFNVREESWCKHEKKVVYNPKKKLHCPYCLKKI